MYISSFFNEVTGVANESAPFQGWRSVTWQRCVSCVRKIGFVFCFGMRARAWEWVCLWVSNSVRLISLSNSLSLNLYRSLCLSAVSRCGGGRPLACLLRPPALACCSRLLCAAPAAGLLRSPRERGGECATQASCGCASRPGGALPSGCRGGSAWLPDGAWRRPPPFSSSAVAQRTAWGGPA